MELKGKTALVTGGCKGIGAAIAIDLAANGADVGLTYLASASRLGTEVVERRFRGERAAVRERAAEAALGLLLRAARRLEEGGAARPAGGAKTCATA